MRSLRLLIGFVLACLAAALTLVAFVYTPTDLAGLPAEMSGDRLLEAGAFALAITPHLAVFAALPALIGLSFAEARGIGSWTFYVLIGIGIAVLGFLVQHFTEAPGQGTILQNYALIAFLTAGIAGGLAYWFCSGRAAARRAGPPPAAPASDPPPAAASDKLASA